MAKRNSKALRIRGTYSKDHLLEQHKAFTVSVCAHLWSDCLIMSSKSCEMKTLACECSQQSSSSSSSHQPPHNQASLSKEPHQSTLAEEPSARLFFWPSMAIKVSSWFSSPTRLGQKTSMEAPRRNSITAAERAQRGGGQGGGGGEETRGGGEGERH